jgi:hypothetical protein
MNRIIQNRILPLLVLILAIATCQAKTYALILGVNAYPDPVASDGSALKDDQGDPIKARLNGSVNDANSVSRLLTTKFRVPGRCVRELTDSDVSKQGFIDGMKWLVRSVKKGDQIVFYFSGHGGRVDDATTSDGFERVIVLADETLIPGKFFGALAKDLASAGINATFIFDSCYSGGMSRDVLVRSKYYPAVDRLPKARKLALSDFRKATKLRNRVVKGVQRGSGSYAFLFASHDNESASEATVGKFPPHGIFTLALQLLLEEQPKISIRQMYSLFVPTLAKLKLEQVPTFEANPTNRSKRPLVWQQG